MIRPKVSVIIPVYNVERYLEEALNSVRDQELDDLEILCVNDGSTDHSPDVLKRYAEQDPRFHILNQKNAGYGAAVNRGLDAAAGMYCAVVEPDDYVRKDMFRVLYETAERESAEVVKGDYCTFSGKGEDRVFQYIQAAPSKEYYGKIYDSTKMYAIFYVHPTTWLGIYRREFLEKYHIRHNESPGAAFQDNGFWFQVFSFAKRVFLIRDDFYRYRVDNENSSINSGTGSFRIFGEYEFIHDFLERSPELKKRLIYTYSFFRFDNYLARYYQTAPEYQEEFAAKAAEEYRKAEAAGEIDRSLFTPKFSSYLDAMVKDPAAFVREVRRPFPEMVWEEVMERPNVPGLIEGSFLPESQTKLWPKRGKRTC